MEYKSFALEELKADDDTRRISGFGSVFGNTDSQGDIVMPGAFAKSIARRKPVMLWQHDTAQPLGVWDTAEERAKGLYLDGPIGTKGICEYAYEQAKMGSVTGLSIGFSTTKYSIDATKGVRKLEEVELYEVSLVTFPANAKATITGVKAVNPAEAELASKWLKRAIDLHQKHMDGTEPTTGDAGERSQMRMMDMMKKAYAYLTGDDDTGGMPGMGKSMTERQFEEFLRDVGRLSQKEAKIVLSEGYRGLLKHRDGGAQDLEELCNTLKQFKL